MTKSSLSARAIEELNTAAKVEVLTLGRADGNEHLASFDSRTGAIFRTVSSQHPDQVAVSDELLARLFSREAALIVHHNHPRDCSFSPADLEQLRYPGLSKIFAHGHGGSSYWATGNFDEKLYKKVNDIIRCEMDDGITSGDIEAHQADFMHGHIVNSTLSNFGLIHYEADFGDKAKEIYADHQEYREHLPVYAVAAIRSKRPASRRQRRLFSISIDYGGAQISISSDRPCNIDIRGG